MNAYAQRINRVIDYVSEHLSAAHVLDDLAAIAGFSPYHFHRIFTAMTGETVQGFTRRLRLEKAAQMIRHGRRRPLIEVAQACGYDTLPSFSRAFKRHHGVAPSQAPRAAAGTTPMQAHPVFDEAMRRARLTAEAAPGVEVRRVRLPALQVAYVRVVDPTVEGRMEEGLRLLTGWAAGQPGVSSARLFGMSQDDVLITPMERYRYDWCLEVPEGVVGEGRVGVRRLPANEFATADVRGGHEAVVRAWDGLYQQWLPSSRYEPTHDPAMEIYRTSPLELGWEQWDLVAAIPVRPLSTAAPG